MTRRVAATAAVIAMGAGCAAQAFFPCGEAWQFIAMQLVALGASLAAYRLTPSRSPAGWATLLCAWLLLSWGCAANLHQWTLASGHTVTHPLLMCDDDALARRMAMDWLGINGPLDYAPWLNQYAAVVAAMISIFGLSVIPPLGLSMMASLLTVVLAGVLSQRVVTVRSARWRSAAAMVMIAAQAYWLTMGTVMMKEALVSLGVTMMLAGMTVLWRPCHRRSLNILCVTMLAAGTLLVGLLRLPMAMLTAVAALFLARRGNFKAVAGVLVLALCVFALMRLTNVTIEPADYMTQDTLETDYYRFFNERESQAGYMRFVGDFAAWPWWRRVMWTPVAMAVQWVIPLAWNAGADIHRAVTLAYAHQGWVWYLEGGLALAWLVTSLGGPHSLRRVTVRLGLWLVMAWAVIACAYGGTVSRYLLPMMPLAVTLATQALGEWPRNRPERIAFIAVYLPLLAAALTLAALL